MYSLIEGLGDGHKRFDHLLILGFSGQNSVASEGSTPVAPESAIRVVAPGVKLSELGAFCFSPPGSSPTSANNSINDDTPPGLDLR